MIKNNMKLNETVNVTITKTQEAQMHEKITSLVRAIDKQIYETSEAHLLRFQTTLVCSSPASLASWINLGATHLASFYPGVDPRSIRKMCSLIK